MKTRMNSEVIFKITCQIHAHIQIYPKPQSTKTIISMSTWLMVYTAYMPRLSHTSESHSVWDPPMTRRIRKVPAFSNSSMGQNRIQKGLFLHGPWV